MNTKKSPIKAITVAAILFLICAFALTACGTQEEPIPAFNETATDESDYDINGYDDYPAEYPTDPAIDLNDGEDDDEEYPEPYNGLDDTPPLPENAVPAIPKLLPVYVNDTHFAVPAYYVEGHHYFYLRDVFYILQGTLAEFWLIMHGPYSPVRTRGIDGEYGYASPLAPTMWNRPTELDLYHFPIVPGLRPLPQDTKHAVPITFWFNNQNWLTGGSFGVVAPMDAFEIDNRLYVDLDPVGQAMGFDTYFDAQAEAFHINTHEPFVSDYGWQAAYDFTMPFLQHDVYYNESGHYVWGYHLYDLDGSGIPAVVLSWGQDISRWNQQTLYMYKQGRYVAVADIGLHIFYRCRQGEMFLYSGDLGGYSGLFGSFYSVTQDDDGLHLSLLYGDVWCSESHENVVYKSSMLEYMGEEAFFASLEWLPMATVPGNLDEPLFRIRYFLFE